MWQVVYIAADETETRQLKEKLSGEGFLVKTEEMEDGSFQILVPESEAEDVSQFLNEYY